MGFEYLTFVLLPLMKSDRFRLCNDVKKAICIRGLKRRKKSRRYGYVYSSTLPLLDICKVYK